MLRDSPFEVAVWVTVVSWPVDFMSKKLMSKHHPLASAHHLGLLPGTCSDGHILASMRFMHSATFDLQLPCHIIVASERLYHQIRLIVAGFDVASCVLLPPSFLR